MDNKIRDLAIIGAGPAGLAAALYGRRYNLDILLFGEEPGGMANYAPEVENYPGIRDVSGIELMRQFQDQVKALGVESIRKKVVNLRKEKNIFILKTATEEVKSKTVILATGSKKRKLNIKGEKEFVGKGVHYCFICDAALYRNKKVIVVGGGDAAFRAAEVLLHQDNEVYLIDVAKKFFAAPALIDKIKKNKRAHLIQKNSIIEIRGSEAVKSVLLNKPYKDTREILVEGVFVEIGAIPESGLAKEVGVIKEKEKEIPVNHLNETKVPGFFAAGDVTNIMGTKQIITAAAQGVVAATSAYKYLTVRNQ